MKAIHVKLGIIREKLSRRSVSDARWLTAPQNGHYSSKFTILFRVTKKKKLQKYPDMNMLQVTISDGKESFAHLQKNVSLQKDKFRKD